jgi:hypothetical protein
MTIDEKRKALYNQCIEDGETEEQAKVMVSGLTDADLEDIIESEIDDAEAMDCARIIIHEAEIMSILEEHREAQQVGKAAYWRRVISGRIDTLNHASWSLRG